MTSTAIPGHAILDAEMLWLSWVEDKLNLVQHGGRR